MNKVKKGSSCVENLSTIEMLVHRYYSLQKSVTHGDGDFQERMALSADIIKKSRDAGIYYFRRTLLDSKSRTSFFPWGLKEKQPIINLASNDYLNFSQHPDVIETGLSATRDYGIGSGSTPMLTGTFRQHRELEKKLASFLGCEDCLLFNSGYAANYGVFSTLLSPGDAVIMDTLVHASVIDGIRNCDPFFFLHNDMESLERALKKAKGYRNKLVVIDGVYSMDGDIAKLRDIHDLTRKYGAYLAMDDAHGIGVLGENGKGTANHFGLDGAVDLITGSFGKALAGVGGFVCGRREWIQFFELSSRPYLFSSSIPPAVAAALMKQIEILESGRAPIESLWRNTNYVSGKLSAMGFDTGLTQTPIIPILVRDESKVLELCGLLQAKGIFVNPIIYPVVSKNKSRLRISLTAGLSREELDHCLQSLQECGHQTGMLG